MIFDVEVNGRRRRLSIEPLPGTDVHGGRFHLSVDGAAHDLSAVKTDLGLSIVYADGRTVDAAMTERSGGEWFVQLPGASLTASVDGRRSHAGSGTDRTEAGDKRVTAPMPGRIVRILVKQGEDVAARQGLIVVEAMKMENELGAPKAGRVKAIAVSEGMSVEAGRLLLVVE